MKPLRIIILGLLLATWITPALAVCTANGQTYDTGTVIGNYQCQSNGTWKRVGGG